MPESFTKMPSFGGSDSESYGQWAAKYSSYMLLTDQEQFDIMVGTTVRPEDAASAAAKKKYAEKNLMVYA